MDDFRSIIKPATTVAKLSTEVASRLDDYRTSFDRDIETLFPICSGNRSADNEFQGRSLIRYNFRYGWHMPIIAVLKLLRVDPSSVQYSANQTSE
jgi:hypothetical protein